MNYLNSCTKDTDNQEEDILFIHSVTNHFHTEPGEKASKTGRSQCRNQPFSLPFLHPLKSN